MVSVIIPNYNHASFLQQRIDSILNQTYQNFELIILDDCSTDHSRDIIEQYRNHEKVSCIIYNEVNSGSTFKQWNRGVGAATGEYVWIAESDDVADKCFLEMLIKKLDENPAANITYCQSFTFSANDEITGDWRSWTDDIDEKEIFKSDFCLDGNEFIQQFLLYKNVLPNASAVLFKRKAFETAGGTDEDIKYCADWLLWLKLLTTGKLCFTAAPLNYFRFHEKSVIAQAMNTDRFYLPYNMKMRRRFNLFLAGCASKNVSVIKALNTKLLGAEASTTANYMLSVKQFSKAFYFFLIAMWSSVMPERKKIAGLFLYNFRKTMLAKNINTG